MIFEAGFTHNGFSYGWFKKELYRTPSDVNGKNFGLKKLKLIQIGNNSGYLCSKHKFTIAQLIGMTVKMKAPIIITKGKDVPTLK